MEKVIGIGGIFMKAKNPMELQKWYQDHLGIPVGEDGSAVFLWRETGQGEAPLQTVWSLFPQTTDYFAPSTASCMINYQVKDLGRMLTQLREAGVTIEGELAEEYGRFAWVMDPEGNKIELWETPVSDADLP